MIKKIKISNLNDVNKYYSKELALKKIRWMWMEEMTEPVKQTGN
jgi:hypothetical protein